LRGLALVKKQLTFKMVFQQTYFVIAPAHNS